MRAVKLYLILWEPAEPTNNGQPGTSFTEVPAGFVSTVEGFLKNVAAESGSLNNVYSVDKLYGDGSPGEYNAEFGGTFRDEDLYPARSSACPTGGELPPSSQPCISDGEGPSGENDFQLSEETLKFLNAHPSLSTELKAIYVVLTPPGVNSCAGFEGGTAACNTNVYCAYHSYVPFTYKGSSTVHDLVYANMPYDDVSGCRTPDQPNGNPGDDEIDTLSHETNEAITDPLLESWYDYQGQEVADKCTYPFFNPSTDSNPEEDAYGTLLGGVPGTTSSPGTGYNQELNKAHYLTQREWSNTAGGCVQRAPGVKAAFTVTQQAERELTFNAAPSTTEAGEIEGYKWEFSDEPGSSRSGEEVKRTFAAAGPYKVKLTVTNNSGTVGVSEQEIMLQPGGGGGILTSTTTTTSTTTSVTTEPAATIIATSTTTEPAVTTSVTFSAAPLVTTTTITSSEGLAKQYMPSEIAKLLGLPSNGAKLSGAGAISFGNAACPPACGAYAHLFAVLHKGRRTRRIQIGSLQEVVATKGSRAISLRLTEKGQKLLRAHHTLGVTLDLTVEDPAGASWAIERHLTLTSAGMAARRSIAAARKRS